MAVTQVAEHEASEEPRRPARISLPGAAWTSGSQARKSWPIVKLLADIWSVPEVSKIGVIANGAGIHVWVFLPNDDEQAESRIFLAERSYLQETSLHTFELDIVPLSRVHPGTLPTCDVVLER